MGQNSSGRDGGVQINLGYKCNGQIRRLLWEGSYSVTPLSSLVGGGRGLVRGQTMGDSKGPAGRRCLVLHPALMYGQ